MKDETAERQIMEFIGLHAKLDYFNTSNQEKKRRKV